MKTSKDMRKDPTQRPTMTAMRGKPVNASEADTGAVGVEVGVIAVPAIELGSSEELTTGVSMSSFSAL